MEHYLGYHFDYEQTPRSHSRPVKLDSILEQRLQMFVRKRAALTQDVEIEAEPLAGRRK